MSDEILTTQQLAIAGDQAELRSDAGDDLMSINPAYLLSIVRSHEALRIQRDQAHAACLSGAESIQKAGRIQAERDLVLSIAERFADGWVTSPMLSAPGVSRWVRPGRTELTDRCEDMTPDQIEWFKARADR